MYCVQVELLTEMLNILLSLPAVTVYFDIFGPLCFNYILLILGLLPGIKDVSFLQLYSDAFRNGATESFVSTKT